MAPLIRTADGRVVLRGKENLPVKSNVRILRKGESVNLSTLVKR